MMEEISAEPEPQGEQAEEATTLSGFKRLLRRQMTADRPSVPGIPTVMVDAFNIVQDRISRSRLAGDPPDVMITPKLHGIGLFDFHRAADLIERGETAAKREIDDIAHELEVRRNYQAKAMVGA